MFVALPILLIAAWSASRAGAWLVREDPLDKADAIVVLGGSMYERPMEAVDLYHAGYAPKIYLLRENKDTGEEELIARGISYLRQIDVQIDALVKAGVPREAIGILEHADNTAEEASFVRRLVTTEHLSKVIIVTSKQHTRRARLVMNRRLRDTGATVIMRATRYDRSDADHWWRNRGTARFTLFEMQRLIAYWLRLAD